MNLMHNGLLVSIKICDILSTAEGCCRQFIATRWSTFGRSKSLLLNINKDILDSCKAQFLSDTKFTGRIEIHLDMADLSSQTKVQIQPLSLSRVSVRLAPETDTDRDRTLDECEDIIKMIEEYLADLKSQIRRNADALEVPKKDRTIELASIFEKW